MLGVHALKHVQMGQVGPAHLDIAIYVVDLLALFVMDNLVLLVALLVELHVEQIKWRFVEQMVLIVGV